MKITVWVPETQVVHQRVFWLFNVVQKYLIREGRLIRIVGVSSRTFLSNNGLFPVAQGDGKQTITRGTGITFH